MKFGIIKRFIDLGWAVLLSDVDIAILQNPFEHLYRDSDVEGMTDGFDEHTAYGAIDGIDDPSMGWARYAQFYKHFNLNSGKHQACCAGVSQCDMASLYCEGHSHGSHDLFVLRPFLRQGE